MKTLLPTLLTLLIAITATAGQKIDIDKLKVKLQYLRVAQSKKISEFETYSVSFDAKQTTLNKLEITADRVRDFFYLGGFSYLPGDEGDFIYSIQIGEPKVIKEKLEESKHEVSDGNGGKKTVTKYRPVLEMSAPTAIQLINNETGEVIHATVFSTPDDPTSFTTKKPDSKANAMRLINIKTGGISTNLVKEYKKQLNAAISKLQKQYSYRAFHDKQVFMDVNVKKSPQLKPLHEDIHTVVNTLVAMGFKKPIYKEQMKLAPILTKWSEEAKKLGRENKYNKKLKFVYLYNLALSQFWLEQFDDALKTSERIIKHDYKAVEGGIIKKKTKKVQAELSKTGHHSRHIARAGFSTPYTYKYEKQKVDKKKWGFLASTVKDFQEIGKSFKEVGAATKAFKESLTLGDTIKSNTAYYSTVTFNLGGVAHAYKKGKLRSGSGKPLREEAYMINCHRKNLVKKQGEFSGFRVNLFNKNKGKEAVEIGAVLSLLNQYKGKNIMDINTGQFLDSVPVQKDGVKADPKLTSWAEYGKALAGDVEFMFVSNSHDGTYSYKTMNGDEFQIELVEKSPIVVQGNGKKCSQGYMAKFRIPSVKLTRFWYGHYSPMYTSKSIKVADLEFYVLLK